MDTSSPRSPATTRYGSLLKSPRSKPPVSLAGVTSLPSPPQSPATEEIATVPIALPPLMPNAVPSPRHFRDPTTARRPLALPLQLDRDYPVAQLDNWPLTSSTNLSWHAPPLPSCPRHESGGISFPASQAASPISPRVRKSHARHRLFDDSKSKPVLLQELQEFVRLELGQIQAPHPIDDDDAEYAARAPPNLQRLQVYRELFRRVIESFNVYAPLLAQIKDEYEATIQHLLVKCQLLPQLHGELQSLEAQCLQQLSEHQLETKLKHKTLKQLLKQTQANLAACAAENAHLKDDNARLTEQLKRLETRYEEMHLSNHSLVNGMKRHDDTLRHIHERSREEGMALQQMTLKYYRACDEIAELKKTVASLEEKVGGVHVAADKATIALLTKDLQEMYTRLVTATTNPLQQGENDDNSVSDDEALHRVLRGVLEKNGAASTDIQLLEMVKAQSLGANGSSPTNAKSQAPLTRLGSTLTTTTSSLNGSSSRVVLPSSASPTKSVHSSSPALAGISSVDLAFGIDRVVATLSDQIAQFHAQSQQLAHRAAQHQHQNNTSTTFLTEPEERVSFPSAGIQILTPLVCSTDLIQTRGTDASVPAYLQYDGVVRNLYYDRRRVELLLAKVWAYKEDLDGKAKRPSNLLPAAGASMRLAQVFLLYLQRCFPSNRHDQAECAYNVVTALDRFAAGSSECRMFKLILENELPEEARVDQAKEFAILHDVFSSMQRELKTQTQRPGLPLAEVIRTLRRHYPWKDDQQLSRLHRALLGDARGQPLVDVAAFSQLQDETASRHPLTRARTQSEFVGCLLAQYIDDLLSFRRYVQHQISQQCIPMHAANDEASQASSNGASMVAVRVLRECLQRCDPAKPVQDINRLLATATGLSPDQILTHDAMMVSAAQFVATLPTLLVKPSGKFGTDARGAEPHTISNIEPT